MANAYDDDRYEDDYQNDDSDTQENDEQDEGADKSQDDSEKQERKRNHIDRLKQEKEELKERLKKYEKDDEQEAPAQKKHINKNSSDDEWRERMELRIEGYDNDQTDFILKNGGREALENKHVKAALNSMKEQEDAESAQVTGSHERSETLRGYTDEEINAMSSEDLEKAILKKSGHKK